MAREYGRLWLSIWSDGDFVELDSRTQRLYMLLTSQPGMSTCGVLSYAPGRWSQLAPDTTRAGVERSISALEGSRFVVVDRSTEELLVRSYLRHDKALRTANVAKSLARTWREVASPSIRRVILDELQRHYVDCGDNGWPGWKVPEIQDLLERASE